jgi:hypothetical protein
MLPTTRLASAIKRALGAEPDVAGPSDPKRVKPRPKGLAKRVVVSLRAGLRLANRVGEEWFRQGLTWYYQRRGYIVLFDRHFFHDFYANDIARRGEGQPLTRFIHGWMLERLYPHPDLVIYLDAPAEVLFARKGEGTVEALERRRQDYLHLRDLVKHFATVDATQSEDEVADDVAKLIVGFYEEKMRNATGKGVPQG